MDPNNIEIRLDDLENQDTKSLSKELSGNKDSGTDEKGAVDDLYNDEDDDLDNDEDDDSYYDEEDNNEDSASTKKPNEKTKIKNENETLTKISLYLRKLFKSDNK